MFKYPLTRKELFENSAVALSEQAFMQELDALVKNNLLQEEDDFILNLGRGSQDISKRLLGNRGASDIMPLASEYSRRIASFPFVEAVLLSGGISKNYFDENGDIDYFIITKPNRLWICRTLLILRYKLLPAHAKKYWCTNYFISSDSLAIPDVNLFTATELAYLLPVVNYPLYKKLLSKNAWYKKRFPNKPEAAHAAYAEKPKLFFKSCVEFLLNGKLGQWLDNRLLSITLRRWRKKHPAMNEEDFDVQFRSRKDVCKRHSHGFQNKVLVAWQHNRQQFEKRSGVLLSPKK